MMKVIKTIFYMFLLLDCLFISTGHAAEKQKLHIGDIPPGYLGKDTEGQKFNLEDHKGKVIVISFWASWCAPCRKELPVLNAIQQKVGKDRLRVVAINFKQDNRSFRIIKKKLSHLKLTITRDKRGSIGRKFGVKGIPHLLIIGKDGKIAYQTVGYGTGSVKKLIRILNELLAKPS